MDGIIDYIYRDLGFLFYYMEAIDEAMQEQGFNLMRTSTVWSLRLLARKDVQ